MEAKHHVHVKRALAHALPVAAVVLALFYVWFGVANRYVIFLYTHLGATPFDARTRSRYWMAGLVAAGIVMVLYNGLLWAAGRLAARRGRTYTPPPAWQVFALSVPLLAVGIPAITMTVNAPVLPLRLALLCAAVALMGLALALWPGRRAAQQPRELAWLFADGAGLVLPLTLLRILELPAAGIMGVTPRMARVGTLVAVVAAVVWLAGMTWLRRWRRRPTPGAGALFAAGLAWSYLLLPLLHYVQNWYITVAENFMTNDWRLKVAAFAIAGALALAATRARRNLQ